MPSDGSTENIRRSIFSRKKKRRKKTGRAERKKKKKRAKHRFVAAAVRITERAEELRSVTGEI